MPTNKQEYNKRHKQETDKSNSKASIAKMSKVPIKILNEVYDRGIGAYETNIGSVRTKSGKKDPNAPASIKMSPEQWAMARVYSFVNKMEGKRNLNHDTDLAKKVSWYNK